MKFLREINFYEKEGDKLIKSFKLKINIKKLREILNLDDLQDPNGLRVYKLDKSQFRKLSRYLIDFKDLIDEDIEIYYEVFSCN